ncbi:MAG: PLP-dependent aminotransferase family protein [Paludibacteraceae bacterium]|nr:PLP-dependent aminotransferase family protein [Paludibacteraceae bacterium]
MNATAQCLFAQRMEGVPRSFIREILKVAVSPEVISFAGGLPNKELFPLEELQECAEFLLSGSDRNVLQYANTEGYLPLREKIAERYAQKGLQVNPTNILITNGSQQGLDLLGKIFINEGDSVLIEEPGYLGAIQAFSIFKPRFTTVPLTPDGIDVDLMQQAMQMDKPKLAYLIPNFQNPSGISYTEETRKEVAILCEGKPIFLVEDDPYGDIRFKGQRKHSFYHYLPEQTILLGTFSKTVVPTFRLGWIVAPDDVMERLIIAKQAADLHTDNFTQRLIHQYLSDYDVDNHIARICQRYGSQAEAMINAIERYFPKEVQFTRPKGGMFLWLTLPEWQNAMTLFNKAIKENVAFVPGNPFYVNKTEVNTCRLNFSCSNEQKIEEGIRRLGKVMYSL